MSRTFSRLLAPLFVTCFLAGPVSAQTDVVAPHEAAKHVGETCTIEFLVKSTGNSRKENLTFINSEENYRLNRNFSIVIEPESLPKWKAAGIADVENHYFGKKVRITGVIRHFKSVTDVLAKSPGDILIVEEKPERDPKEVPPTPTPLSDSFDPTPPSYWPYALVGVGLLGVCVGVGLRQFWKKPEEGEPQKE